MKTILPALSMIAMILASCTPATLAPTPIPLVNTSQPTVLVASTVPAFTSTPIPPTATPTPIPPTDTPAPTPTPTEDPQKALEALLPEAGALCEKVSTAPVESGELKGPVLAVVQAESGGTLGWYQAFEAPHLAPQSADDLGSIACVSMSSRKTGSYSDGNSAYQVTWRVRLVSWPDGAVRQDKSFLGGPPPVMKSKSGPGYGASPVEAVIDWLFTWYKNPNVFDFRYQPDLLVVSPDGRLAAVSDTQGFGSGVANFTSSIYIIDLESKRMIHTLPASSLQVVSITFTNDSKMLVWSDMDYAVKFWRVFDEKQSGEIQLGNAEPAIALLPLPGQSTIAAVTYNNVYFIDPQDMRVTSTLYSSDQMNLSLKDYNLTLQGKALAAIDSEDMIRVIDLTSGDVLLNFPKLMAEPVTMPDGSIKFELPPRPIHLAASPDGKVLAASAHDFDQLGSDKITLWDSSAGNLLQTLAPSSPQIQRLVFSPDGSRLATGNLDGTVWVWDTATWQRIAILRGHSPYVNNLAFLPDGRSLVSASVDGTSRIWDIPQVP